MDFSEVRDLAEVTDQAAGAFFAGEDSSVVTGQTLLVDGGWLFG